MNLKERMEKFNKRWSIVSEDSYEEAFDKFKIRILNVFKGIDGHVEKSSIIAFCQYYGIEEVWHTDDWNRPWSTNIIDRLNAEGDEKEYYRLVELIFSLDINSTSGYDHQDTYSRSILFGGVARAVELSDVNVSITAHDGEVTLYPKGEEKLDSELVDLPLSFLNKESGEHFVQALLFYQAKKHIKSAESLRRSLEEFLKYKLKNTKGLNANITELQKQIKSNGRDVQVRNIIGSTFNCLDQYFNENSKHNDGDIYDAENEFLIYQTGVLMRYVNSIK